MPPFVETARQALELRARRIGLGVAIDAAAIAFAAVALFFFTYAAFVLTERWWGTVAACLALGVAYLALSLALYWWSRRVARRPAGVPRSESARYLLAGAAGAEKGGVDWIAAPVIIAAGIEVLRRIGARRLIPAFALSAVALAAAQTTMRAKPADAGETSKDEKTQARS